MKHLPQTQKKRALTPGPVPGPCARRLQGPDLVYSPLEHRFFWGRPAGHLAELAKDQMAMQVGRKRPGASARFVSMTYGIIKALCAYVLVKQALWRLTQPFAKRRPRRTAKRYILSKPRKAAPRRYHPVPEKDWAALEALYGFDVRMTSPKHIIRRAEKIRRARFGGAAAKPAPGKQTASKQAGQSGKPRVKPIQPEDDLFAIWPPIALPKNVPCVNIRPENTGSENKRSENTLSAPKRAKLVSNISDNKKGDQRPPLKLAALITPRLDFGCADYDTRGSPG